MFFSWRAPLDDFEGSVGCGRINQKGIPEIKRVFGLGDPSDVLSIREGDG
jgi:hypothetical protein